MGFCNTVHISKSNRRFFFCEKKKNFLSKKKKFVFFFSTISDHRQRCLFRKRSRREIQNCSIPSWHPIRLRCWKKKCLSAVTPIFFSQAKPKTQIVYNVRCMYVHIRQFNDVVTQGYDDIFLFEKGRRSNVRMEVNLRSNFPNRLSLRVGPICAPIIDTYHNGFVYILWLYVANCNEYPFEIAIFLPLGQQEDDGKTPAAVFDKNLDAILLHHFSV